MDFGWTHLTIEKMLLLSCGVRRDDEKKNVIMNVCKIYFSKD